MLWIQAQNCTGCSVSLLNCEMPGIAKVITQLISLKFHSNVSAATGDVAMDVIEGTVKAGGYTLVVEGSIPVGMPSACLIGHEPVAEQIVRAAKNASAVLAVGTCAAFGGIPAAENNPTGAIDVVTHLKNEGVSTPVIRLPGCPAHPDWMIGTIVHAKHTNGICLACKTQMEVKVVDIGNGKMRNRAVCPECGGMREGVEGRGRGGRGKPRRDGAGWRGNHGSANCVCPSAR